MIPYIVYSLTAKVYGEKGIIVADYFETRNYRSALETFDDMITEARVNQFGFAGSCEIIFTKTFYGFDGKVTGSDQIKVHVHGEEVDI